MFAFIKKSFFNSHICFMKHTRQIFLIDNATRKIERQHNAINKRLPLNVMTHTYNRGNRELR